MYVVDRIINTPGLGNFKLLVKLDLNPPIDLSRCFGLVRLVHIRYLRGNTVYIQEYINHCYIYWIYELPPKGYPAMSRNDPHGIPLSSTVRGLRHHRRTQLPPSVRPDSRMRSQSISSCSLRKCGAVLSLCSWRSESVWIPI